MRGALLWLQGFLRFEPRVVMSKVRLAAKVRHLGEGIRAVLRQMKKNALTNTQLW